MRKYRLVAKKGEGTFSEVLKAQNVKDGRYHAIKCMKNRFENIDQVNNLREIQALRRLSPHQHVISLEEVLYDQPTGRLALVFELMDANLYELIRGRRHYLNPNLVKSYMWQLMKSLDHMHKKGIFHRDIKPENILIESSTDVGRGLKLADFGSCRGIYSKQPYTEYISTRWYRAPECLLTDGYYGPEMDLWGAGCVMFEITSLYPLFPGSNEVDQINRIHKVLGTPSPEVLAKFKSKGASHISFDFQPQKGIGIPHLIPHAPPDSVDLMVKLLKYDASERITAKEAMRHPYFKDIHEAEAKQAAEAKALAHTTAPVTGTTTEGSSSSVAVSNKPLPSIAGTQQVASSSTSQYVMKNNTVNAATQELQMMQQQQLQQQQQLLLNQQAHASKQAAQMNSSLPPIVSSLGTSGSQYSKYGDQKSGTGKSNFPMSNTQKRRKKYRMNYLQPSAQSKQRQAQNSESVLKAYGVPKMLSQIDSSGISAGSSGGGSKYGMGANAYGQPNRHFLGRKN